MRSTMACLFVVKKRMCRESESTTTFYEGARRLTEKMYLNFQHYIYHYSCKTQSKPKERGAKAQERDNAVAMPNRTPPNATITRKSPEIAQHRSTIRIIMLLRRRDVVHDVPTLASKRISRRLLHRRTLRLLLVRVKSLVTVEILVDLNIRVSSQ
jgi:hypothetical protein